MLHRLVLWQLFLCTKYKKHALQAGLVASVPLHKIQKHALQADLVAASPVLQHLPVVGKGSVAVWTAYTAFMASVGLVA